MAEKSNKKSFVVYMDWEEALSYFSDAETGEIFRALFQYAKNGTMPEFSHNSLNAVFSFMKSTLDRDLKAYEERCRKNKENGSKGGRPKKPNGIEENQKKPNGYFSELKKADNDNVSDNDNDNVNDNDNGSGSENDFSDGGDSNTSEYGKLEAMHGSLGKGVVFLTEEQEESLLDILGLDGFNRYVERLADFIINKNANVKNHYETILKWHKEDTAVKKSTGKFNDNNFGCLTKSNPKTAADDDNIRLRAEALKQQFA